MPHRHQAQAQAVSCGIDLLRCRRQRINTNHAARTIIVQQTPHTAVIPSAFDSTEVSGSSEYYRGDADPLGGH